MCILKDRNIQDAIINWIRLMILAVLAVLLFTFWKDHDPDVIVDGFGNAWYKYCSRCGAQLQIVRPGKVQCPNCG